MIQVHNNKELMVHIREWKRRGQSIAFVPTMGNLHEGHLSLLRLAQEQADKLVSSIYVNPMQFGPGEDLENYPRTLEQDCKSLMEHRCDLAFLPSNQDLYPDGLENMTQIRVPGISERLEGKFRPGHLTGVSTIVLKLFNLVQPDLAVFGKKDYQQWRMIDKMVKDLDLPIDIIAGETVREADGLAMSSRNQYLDSEQRSKAGNIYQQLVWIREQIHAGNEHYEELVSQASRELSKAGFKLDYFSICERHDLHLPSPGDPLVVLAATRLGDTRLIDNIEV